MAGGTIVIAAQPFTDFGPIKVARGATLAFPSGVAINSPGSVASQAGGLVALNGGLLGNTRQAGQFSPQGTWVFNPGNNVLEVMSRDMGDVAAGYVNNFAYGTITLSGGALVELADQAANSGGPGADCLYVNSLVVPAGSSLNLNGLHLYARLTQIGGEVTGGTVSQVPCNGGALTEGAGLPGTLSTAGVLDEFTFFGRAGQLVAVAVDTGSAAILDPKLNYAEVKLLDPSTNLLCLASNSVAGATVLLSNVPLTKDGTYRVRVRAPADYPASTGNFQVTVWNVTASVKTLALNQTANGRISNPYDLDQWNFSASAGTQIRFNLLNVSSPGVAFDLTGPTNWVGFSNLAASSELINLPASGGYRLTAHGTGGAYDIAYAFQIVQTTVTDVPLGTPYKGTLAGSGDAQLFRITTSIGQPLLIQFTDASSGHRNELYAKFGSPPTRSDYGYRFSGASSQNEQILIPSASAGTWYVLVYGDYVPDSGPFTMTAVSAPCFATGVTPGRIGNSSSAVFTFTGAGFGAGAVVELVGATGCVFAAQSTEVDSGSRITATFAAGALPPGNYTAQVRLPGQPPQPLSGVITITSGGTPHLVTNLVVPSVVGRHTLATIYVEYANTGDAAMPAPLLVLTSNEQPLLTLARDLVTEGLWTPTIPAGFSTNIQILASGDIPGVLQPGESRSVPVYYVGLLATVVGWPDVQFNLGVLTPDNTSAVDWASLQGDMRPASIPSEAWGALWAGFVARVGPTWGDYARMLADNAAYLGRLGQNVTDVSQLLVFALQQADGLSPTRTLASAVDAAVDAPGLPLNFARVFPEPISQRYLLGSLGRGWSHNWDYHVESDGQGNVSIVGPGGSRRLFQADSRPPTLRYGGGLYVTTTAYFSQKGDNGILTTVDGHVFYLHESHGLLRAFRSDGKLDYIQDPNGNRITCAYSGSLLTSLTHSSGQSLTLTYNGAGRIATITDSLSRHTTLSYDGSGEHLLSIQTYDGRASAYAYVTGQGLAQEHALSQIAYPGGSRRYFAYDAQGRLANTCRDGNAENLTFSYDSAGTVTATDAMGGASAFYFDCRGLLSKTRNALGNAVYLSFDGAYNLTEITDPAGTSYSYAYDAKGNLVRSTDALGNPTQFSYTSAFNRLASVTDANGNPTKYAYDAHGNLTSISYANNSRETWAYDTFGNATAWNNRRGHAVNYAYDANGRITGKTYQDGSQVNFTYDARGNLVQTVDATGTNIFAYSATDYLTRIDYPHGQWLQFTYDGAGRRASSLDQTGHQVTYAYDAAGRLHSMTNELGVAIVQYTYDPAGRLNCKTLGNGVHSTYGYDAAGQLLSLTNFNTDSSVLSYFDYRYDSRGRRTAMNTSYGLWTYQYDDIGQLTHAVLASTDGSISNQDLAYVYDALGNRIRTSENGVTTAYTVNNMNQYVSVGGTNYVFDVDGNLVQETSPGGTTTYTYNDDNRLTALTSPQGTWQYSYDGLGNRVATTENGVTKRFVIDPIGLGNVVGEYDASGNLLTHYDHGLGLVSRTDAAGNPAYYTFDGIGNVQQLVASAGAIANSYAYAPFGSLLKRTETIPNPFQFVGQFGVITEANELSQMRERYYEADTGRFISHDPMRSVSHPHDYAYVRNAPTRYVDPSGRFWQRPAVTLIVFYLTHAQEVNEALVWAAGKLFDFGSGTTSPMPGTSIYDLADADKELIKQDWEMISDLGRDKEVHTQGPAVVEVDTPCPDELPTGYDDPPGNGGNFPGGNSNPPLPPATTLVTTSSSNPHSADPNDKIGPSGFGAGGYITANGVLPYRIDFENETNATAAAQQVTITDPLSTNLDLSTFQLTEIGFGDVLLAIPQGSQCYEDVVPMTYNGVDFNVEIYAGIDFASGEMYADFYSIDPNTALPPSVLVGFLPPEDGTGRGQGHVSYTIQLKPGLPTGTQIRNVALITFDENDPIATDQIDPHDPSAGTDPLKQDLVTVDAVAPDSHVLALPAQLQSSAVAVRWTGQDDAGGSGIASYDVYVSDNGGAWTLWQSATAGTNATFQGTPLHIYGFYSVARDNAGNVEAAPLTADARTLVGSPLLRLTVTSSVTNTYVNENVRYTIAVRNTGPTVLSGVVLNDTLPYELSADWVQFGRGSCAFGDSSFTWSLGSLATNVSATLTVSATAIGTGTLTNFVAVADASGAAFISAIQTLQSGLPLLGIARTGQVTLVSWPLAATTYLLETTTNLAAQTDWSAVPDTPVAVGGLNTVTNGVPETRRFYRLYSP